MIDSYRFGRMVIDGIPYTSDLIILPGYVHSNWQRKQGHNLCIEDVEGLIDCSLLNHLVVGTGKFGRMRIGEEFLTHMKENGVSVHSLPTAKAADLYNSLLQNSTGFGGAFHLTC